jgi:hypothetical protein
MTSSHNITWAFVTGTAEDLIGLNQRRCIFGSSSDLAVLTFLCIISMCMFDMVISLCLIMAGLYCLVCWIQSDKSTSAASHVYIIFYIYSLNDCLCLAALFVKHVKHSLATQSGSYAYLIKINPIYSNMQNKLTN